MIAKNLALTFFLLTLILSSCGKGSSSADNLTTDTVTIQHFNIVIVPDLSNRINQGLYPKSVEDIQIIEELLGEIYPDILSYKRTENQKDKLRISFINEGIISLYNLKMESMEIDFGLFKKQLDRINYIKGRSEKTLQNDIEEVSENVRMAYRSARDNTFGADIWSYFNRIDNFIIEDESDFFSYQAKVYKEEFKNVILLLTDGYLEAGIYDETGCSNSNQCYFMSGNTIKKFRKAFKSSGQTDLKSFFKSNGYGITPVKNEALKNVDVLLLEAYDRSLDRSGNATVFPSDLEIMSLFWEEWMRASGVRKFRMLKTATSISEVNNSIDEFIFDK